MYPQDPGSDRMSEAKRHGGGGEARHRPLHGDTTCRRRAGARRSESSRRSPGSTGSRRLRRRGPSRLVRAAGAPESSAFSGSPGPAARRRVGGFGLRSPCAVVTDCVALRDALSSSAPPSSAPGRCARGGPRAQPARSRRLRREAPACHTEKPSLPKASHPSHHFSQMMMMIAPFPGAIY